MAGTNANILQNIHQSFNQVIKKNFSKEIALEANVVSINVDQNFFIIQFEEIKIECKTNLDVSKLKIDDVVRLKGMIQMDPTVVGKIVIYISYFYLANNNDKLSLSIASFMKLKSGLTSEKCQNFIKQIYAAPIPNTKFKYRFDCNR